jgi:hypothetical protein
MKHESRARPSGMALFVAVYDLPFFSRQARRGGVGRYPQSRRAIRHSVGPGTGQARA